MVAIFALLGAFGLAVFLSLPGCTRHPASSPAAPPAAPSAAPTAPSGPRLDRVPDFSPSLPVPSRWAEDPLWQRAFGGDPLDLARLAQREGAAGLVEAAEAGGKVGLTALAALPRSDDAELALGWLCAVAERVPPDRTRPLVEAIREILAQPERQAERLDGAGRERCGPALAGLEERAQPAEARDLAASARAVLNAGRHDHD
jgi:hypothetical protein